MLLFEIFIKVISGAMERTGGMGARDNTQLKGYVGQEGYIRQEGYIMQEGYRVGENRMGGGSLKQVGSRRNRRKLYNKNQCFAIDHDLKGRRK